MKTFVKNLVFLTVTVSVFLIGTELVFRMVRKNDALTLSLGRLDRKYHHSFKPNSDLHLVSSVPGEYDVTAHINNLGLRGPDTLVEKKAGVSRILLLGDSFTFGVGANDRETIPYLLQQKLDPAEETLEFVNAGRGHSSPLIYYLRLRDELLGLKPDVVVMMLDFSDLWEDWRFEQMLVYDTQGNIVELNPYFEGGKFNLWSFMRARSVLCSYVHNKVVRTALKIQKLGFVDYVRTKLEGKRAKAVIAATRTDTIAYDGRIFLRGIEKAGEIKLHFERTKKYILMCKQLIEAARAQLVLVMYPYGIQVGPDQWGEGRVFWGFEKGKTYDDDFSFHLVKQFATEHSIPFINLTEDLRAHRNQVLYFPYDGHFTPAANQVVAETLSAEPILVDIINQKSISS